MLYGDRDDPATVLSQLGQRLEATIAPAAVFPTIVETVAPAIKSPYVVIALKCGDDFESAVTATPLNGAGQVSVVCDIFV